MANGRVPARPATTSTLAPPVSQQTPHPQVRALRSAECSPPEPSVAELTTLKGKVAIRAASSRGRQLIVSSKGSQLVTKFSSKVTNLVILELMSCWTKDAGTSPLVQKQGCSIRVAVLRRCWESRMCAAWFVRKVMQVQKVCKSSTSSALAPHLQHAVVAKADLCLLCGDQ